MCVFNLVFKRNQSGQLLQVFARSNASILDIISLNCAPETLRRLSKVLRRLFMMDSTLKCAPETSTCAPETFSVLKFAPAKTCSKSARRGARCWGWSVTPPAAKNPVISLHICICNCNCIFLIGSFIYCAYIQNTIGINIKRYFNLWCSTRSWRNSIQIKFTKQIIIFCK